MFKIFGNFCDDIKINVWETFLKVAKEWHER